MKKILLLLAVIANMAGSQTISMKPFETKMIQGTDEHLKHYELLSFNSAAITNQIDAIKGNVKEITLQTPTKSWSLQLFEYSLIAPEYIRYTGGKKSIQLPKRTDLRTFRGTIKGNNASLVNMTVADGYFSIMIDDRKDRYFIEPLDLNSRTSAIPTTQQFMLYKTADLISHEGMKCGADFFYKQVENAKAQVQSSVSALRPCKLCAIVKICLCADYPMYRRYGGSIPMTENQMITILSDVQTVFDDEFENEYQYEVTGTYVPDSQAADYFNGINNINTMLNTFAGIAESTIFPNSQHNVATLWTTKFTLPGEVGTAFTGTVCMNNRYNVCSDFVSTGGRLGFYLTLQAHNLGHNWNMIHDAGIAQTIMAAGFPNSSTSWSGLSVSALNAYVRDNKLIESTCLGICPNSAAPVPDFSADITYGCQPVTVRFKNLSVNSTSWKWRFPGGTPDSSSLKDPVIVYKTAGLYPVTLESSTSRCDVGLTKTDFIKINDVPVADFSFGLQGREIFFIDQSLRPDEWHWNFGDGETSDEQFPFHEFPTDSTFEITLTVKNDCGMNTLKKKIVVESVPTADFTSDTTAGCAPQIIKFIDQSTRNVKTWQWDFTGGTPNFSNQKNPIIHYELPGTYDVRLTVYSSRYHHSVTKTFYITIDSIPVASFSNTINVGKVDFANQSRYAKSHFWDFGDNTSSTEANPTHNYKEGTYKVTYIVSNSCGTDTAVTNFTIGVKPTPAFQTSNIKGCAPYQVQFQNSSIAATSYKWYFPGGNPSTSTDVNPLVTYSNAGKFNVSLVAYNVFYSDSTGKADYIDVRTKPTGTFTNVISGFKSTFTNNTSGATNYLWDFGDKKVSFEKDPVHDYGVEGEFKVRLIAQNECGGDTIIKTIAVYLVPKVNFTVGSSIGCVPYRVQFFDKSSVDVIDWEWQFENGNPSTSKERNPIVVFDKKGKYTVKLTVKNTNGSNAVTRTQFIQVVSTALCPENTKTRRFDFSENPFGVNIENRAGEAEPNYPLIYPNPAKDVIYVYTNANMNKSVQIDIYDLSGRKYSSHSSTENEFKILTGNLRAGTYYLKMNDGSSSTVHKFVISE